MRAEVYRELGLNDQEYQRILSILKREPTNTELAMFSVEWSEHCGYPRSRKWLKLFPQTGKFESLVGEDAGGIVYDDTAIIFKMESHNHPSQVEPKQGAATGVGGILRDIFTSGARPIALFDSLRFGQLDNPFNKYIFSGVIDGIQFYGNCVGVPTVGGEIYFDDAYAGNCLVNVMCIGVCPQEQDRPGAGRRGRQPDHLCRLQDRARRHRRLFDPGFIRIRGGRDRETADRPGRRPVHGESA